ncbi:hypothetical protein ABTY53_31440, partial [Streptomyces noursei]|uniref:hypothetical protein n=1 Tax=Streptomyces noursei TaxID=1971 RepID=UPI00332471B1
HAVEFSRNGRFLCACFTRLSGRFPSVLRFRLYQILSALIFAGAIQPFDFLAIPTLPDPFPSLAPCWSGVRPIHFRSSTFPTLSDPFSCPACSSMRRNRFEFGSEFLSE